MRGVAAVAAVAAVAPEVVAAVAPSAALIGSQRTSAQTRRFRACKLQGNGVLDKTGSPEGAESFGRIRRQSYHE
jgi:hypothetical protein